MTGLGNCDLIAGSCGCETATAAHPARGVRSEKEGSGKYFLNDFTVNVGQSEVPAAIAIGKALVVEAKEMKSGCMQIMNVRAFLDRFEPEVIRGAVGHAAL